MDVLSRPAEEFGNDASMEEMWAMKAFDHAHVYFNLICSVDPRYLRITPLDDTIYKIFRDEFPKLDVNYIKEDELKSTESKAVWRPFCEQFKHIVEDYSYGTLLRSNAENDYTEENSMLVTRIQFLAIELARNREGINDPLRKKFKNTAKKTENSDLIDIAKPEYVEC